MSRVGICWPPFKVMQLSPACLVPYVVTGAQANASLGTGREERNSTCYQEKAKVPQTSADFSFPFSLAEVTLAAHTHRKEIWENFSIPNSIPKETEAGVERLPKVNQPGLIPYKSLFLTDQSQSPIMPRSQFSPLYIKGEWCSRPTPRTMRNRRTISRNTDLAKEKEWKSNPDRKHYHS